MKFRIAILFLVIVVTFSSCNEENVLPKPKAMLRLEYKKPFTFGKYKGRKVTDVLAENPGYYSWIQNADFPLFTKKVLTQIKLRSLNNKF